MNGYGASATGFKISHIGFERGIVLRIRLYMAIAPAG
jgi:hypothetical protein